MPKNNPKKNAYAGLTFDQLIKKFVSSNAAAKQLALLCSNMALEHFYKDGNLSLVQRFHDAMEENWNRRAAYLKWLAAHAPITMEKGAFLKDKSPEAVKVTEELKTAAFSKPFWEYAPEPGEIPYDIADVDTAVRAVLAKFEGKRYVAKTERASTYVGEIKAKLEAGILITAAKASKVAQAAAPSVH